jgi:solute carrier family 20 (sodium-dependent phosphate transporter)
LYQDLAQFACDILKNIDSLTMILEQYLWMVVVGFIFGFGYAFGIGANDVANAFATVVASKSLTLKQAVLVAGIFEFAGAVLLGAAVTNTVRSKIFDVKLYDDEPEILLLGFFCAMITGTIMLLSATALALPVSTTHTIIGSIMGFSITAKGFDSINWDVVIKILVSWVASPVCTGILSFLCFGAVRKFVLESEHCFERTYYTFPIILTLTVGINAFYVIYKGMNNLAWAEDLPVYVSLPVGLGVGFLVGMFWLVAWGPWARARIELWEAKQEEAAAAKKVAVPKGAPQAERAYDQEIDVDTYCTKLRNGEAMDEFQVEKHDATSVVEASDDTLEPTKDDVQGEPEETRGFVSRHFKNLADNTFNQDLEFQSLSEHDRTRELWDSVERYDPKAEQLFTYVQVFTACMDSFAHGANDVANAMAPVSAILLLYQSGEISSKTPVPKWILAYGGLGIVVGLLLYGYKVIKSIGYHMTPISPSRGSMCELSSALFVVTASFLGIPVSTTQSQVGAVAGVGLVGGWRNVQWMFFFKVCISWAIVFFTAILLSAGIFSAFAFTPSLAAPVIDPTDEPTMAPTFNMTLMMMNMTNSTM